MAGTCAGSADAPGRPVLRAVVPWLGAQESWLSTHGDSTTERPRVHLGAEDPWQRRQGPGSVTETSESPAPPGRWPQGPFISVCARGRTRDPRPRPEGLPRARPSARSGDASPPARPAPSLRSSCRWRHPGSSSTCAGTSQHLLQACRLRPRPLPRLATPPGQPRPPAGPHPLQAGPPPGVQCTPPRDPAGPQDSPTPSGGDAFGRTFSRAPAALRVRAGVAVGLCMFSWSLAVGPGCFVPPTGSELGGPTGKQGQPLWGAGLSQAQTVLAVFRGAPGRPGPAVMLAPSVSCPLGSRHTGRGPEVIPRGVDGWPPLAHSPSDHGLQRVVGSEEAKGPAPPQPRAAHGVPGVDESAQLAARHQQSRPSRAPRPKRGSG